MLTFSICHACLISKLDEHFVFPFIRKDLCTRLIRVACSMISLKLLPSTASLPAVKSTPARQSTPCWLMYDDTATALQWICPKSGSGSIKKIRPTISNQNVIIHFVQLITITLGCATSISIICMGYTVS